MLPADPNSEWLGHVQPVGLVVAPSVLARHGLVPQEQTRLDTEEVLPFLSEDESGPAVANPWGFFLRVLGWRPGQVAGAPGGPALPEDLFAWLPESETRLAPDWAVTAPDGGWQLLVQFAARGIDPDTRGALAGWEATPHQRLERLLRETGVPTGLLLTDHELRLVHAPRGETSGWLAFPLRALGSVSGRPMLGGLRLLLSSFRLHNDAAERRLPALLKASRDAQAEVSTKLASQVLGALHELLRGLHEADRARIERLAAQQSAHLYEGLLTVLLRLVFLLYAEDRNLVPSATDAEARALYDNGYGVRALYARLLDDAARQPDTMDERRGAWSRLLALFRLVHAGHHSGWIRGRGGKLFDPAVFPFLQGQDAAADRPAPAPVSDGCILRVLDGLLNLDGERLSYRTLDVEQIGSVYETVMGFTVLTLPGPALAIKAGNNNRTPVFVDLAALAAKRGKDREKYLKDEADRGQLPARVATALGTAGDAVALAEALRPIVDERGSPHGSVPPGTPLLQPTDERRRTGSHYTPRSLTEPIVRHALEPAFARIGPDATPEAVLALKVCDPAMGSGAFLVEACRQLAARLVTAWARHLGTRPPIAEDEDEHLLARRLVAQRCLYGVDRNPMATDLARLSLWLATLARDHEFTFLDHALKSGDSLVGLTRNQIGALTWGDDRQDSAMSGFVRGRVEEAVKARAEIRDAPDDVARAIQEARHRALEARMDDVRALGDAVLACFFGNDKPRVREAARRALAAMPGGGEAMWTEVRRLAATLGHGAHLIRPFHWELEFPEVFSPVGGGFDAMVGNPPFLGGAKIWPTHGGGYVDWLKNLHPNSGGKGVNLVAHFLRRAANLVCKDGAFGFVATNTLAQGDTRAAGLKQIYGDGWRVFRVTRSMRWPGDAAVVVSIVHVAQSKTSLNPTIDDKDVVAINSMFLPMAEEIDPALLASNSGICFRGCDTYGTGFIFTPAGGPGTAGSVEEMAALVRKDPRNADRIRPFIGGRELSAHPRHQHNRYAINFADMDLAQAQEWPDLIAIIEREVRPHRKKLSGYAVAERRRDFWWQYGTYTPALFRAIAPLKRVCATGAAATMHHMISMVSSEQIFSHKTIVFASEKSSFFAVMQCNMHEIWSRTYGTTFGSSDALTYNPLRVFRTFPIAADAIESEAVGAIGTTYEAFRASIMVNRDEGLTQTYNRFHDPRERAADIVELRALHNEMNRRVLEAYAWSDLAAESALSFIEDDTDAEDGVRVQYAWTSAFSDRVMARLLDLNRARAEEERRLGITAGPSAADTDEELEDA